MEKKVIEFNRLYYGGGTEVIHFNNLPEDIKFCKVRHLSSSQQSWLTIHEYSKSLFESLSIIGSNVYKLGNLIYCMLNDVSPIVLYPENLVNMDEFRKLYTPYISTLYVKHTKRDSLDPVRIYKLLDLRDNGELKMCCSRSIQ